ncbi:MAG: Ig-like domain-containing protein, partial [Pseudomonadota bacterium]
MGELTLSGSTASFNVLSSDISAPDGGSTTFTLRATFNNSSPSVRDLDNIRVRVINVTQSAGSELNTAVGSVVGGTWTKATGAVAPGPLSLSPTTSNIVDVVATRVTFTQMPPSLPGVNQPVPLSPDPEVALRVEDANSILDLEFSATNNSKVNLTLAGANPSQLLTSAFDLVQGVVTIPRNSLRYTRAGNGTLTANVSGLPPTVPGGTVAQAVSTPVTNVYHVVAARATGFTTTQNLAGGSVNKVIYGVTFSRDNNYSTAGEPKLNRFVFSFDNEINGIFKNPRVYEQIDNPNYTGGLNITVPANGINGTVSTINPAVSTKTITVNFPSGRDFSAGGGRTYTYFLEVDVETTANSGSQPVTPFVEAGNWNFGTNAFDATATNVQISSGSTIALKTNTSGQTYSFAAIFPPLLASSSPSVGKTNTNVNTDITLTFNAPVWSLDGKIKLFKTTAIGTPGIEVAELALIGSNGQFDISRLPTDPINNGNLNSTLGFSIPAAKKPLDPNTVYYVTVPAGFLDQTVTPRVARGIMDREGNYFGGIGSPGTLFFRTSGGVAPKLLTIDPTDPNNRVSVPTEIINISLNGATIQATFDIPGKAYWVLKPANAIVPNKAQIKTGSVSGALTFGNFDITQTNSIAEYGIINSTLTNGAQYDVWMYAESKDEPLPIESSGPYGSGPTFTSNAGTQTFRFTAADAAGAGSVVVLPYSGTVCSGSFQPINLPITLVEKVTNGFAGTGAGSQRFNIVLPTGFEFDLTKPGKVVLSGGSDFTPNSGSTQFISSSVMEVTYENTASPNASLDRISISGFYVKGGSGAGGNILTLGGTVSTIPATLGLLNTTPTPTVSFKNSFGSGLLTVLPNRLNATPPTSVQLRPVLPANEFGISKFSGLGVNVDSLLLNNVTLNTPFQVTINYTDNNGCVSENSIQYFIYDYTKGLGIETKYCISNLYFPVPSSYVLTDEVKYNAFQGFYLTNLTALPTPGSQFLNGTTYTTYID